MDLNSGLVRGVAFSVSGFIRKDIFHKGGQLSSILLSSEIWSDQRDGLQCKWPYKWSGLSLGEQFLYFYYLSASEIWSNNRDGLGGSGLIRGVVSLEGNSFCILLSQCI